MRAQHILTAALFAAGLALPLSSAAYANIVISINKSTQHMLVSVDGQTRYDWPVSTGRAGFNTPSGTFRPNRMDPMHYSREYENAPMPHTIFFDLHGHAIHGFTNTPFGVAAVSHGCVRLPVADAATLFALVKDEGMANTTVVIGGRIPQRPLVAARQLPSEQAANEPPAPSAPGYQSGYGPGYQSGYASSYGPGYAQQPAPYSAPQPDGRPAYGQWGQQEFPPQPAPTYYYRRPAYAAPSGGQVYYQQPQPQPQPQSGWPFPGF